MKYIEKFKRNLKSIYVGEKHHYLLEAWRKIGNSECILFSIDHHHDSIPAFRKYAHKLAIERGHPIPPFDIVDSIRKDLISKIKEFPIEFVIANLNYDEQVDAAIKLSFFKYAFVVNLMNKCDRPRSVQFENYKNDIHNCRLQLSGENNIPFPERPYTYPDPEDNIFNIGTPCYVGCEKTPHDDDCIKPTYDQCIEDIFLNHKLSVMNEMKPEYVYDSKINVPYVLDIDLDYFHTMKSINPDSISVFYNLIARSEMITIAKECSCVNELKYDNEEINCDIVYNKVMEHIYKATS